MRLLLALLLLLSLGCDRGAPPGAAPSTAAPSSPAAPAAALLAYQEAVLPHLRDGGAIVEQGMKPAMDDLLDRHVVPPATIAAESERWVAELTRVGDAVDGVAPPPALAEAHRLFLAALDAYVRAARTFGDAARAPEAERRTVADRGYATARSADTTYDEASRILQAERRRLGLGPSADFPDPPQAGPAVPTAS